VTPSSQIVGTQAVVNVLLGERYQMVSTELKITCVVFMDARRER